MRQWGAMSNISMIKGESRIESFFYPRSVAIFGATEKPDSAGRIILENLLPFADRRKIYPINPNRQTVLGQKSFPGIQELPETPEMAVIVTPAETVTEIVDRCGAAGVRLLVIISSGFKEIGPEGLAREEKILESAKKYGMRIIGPNCMGLIRPSNHLNTSFIRKMPRPGNVAFLSQSGALGAGILDWAIRANFGFSAYVSFGSMLDVDFGDAIDYFGEDPETRSIIIYPESLGNVKKFMSAARGFARTKPIIVLKPGRSEESARAARSHTGAMIGDDLYYDAIFRRAGVVRVKEMRDLFNSAYVLDAAKLPQGPNIAIITNGGGPAVLAIDNLIANGGKLAGLSEETIAALNNVLPANWNRANPIDIREDADVQRFADTLNVVIKDPGVNGVMVIYTPQGRARAMDVAPVVINEAGKTSKPVVPVWIGADTVGDARKLFQDAKLPVFEFPEDAIKTYLYMWQYARNLDMLYQTPEESAMAGASKNHLKSIIRKSLREGKIQLSQEDASRFLSTYRISTTTPYLAKTPDEAAAIANRMGYPVVLKIASPDIIHKADVSGVVCGLSSTDEVRATFTTIIENVHKHAPEAKLDGISVHRMVANFDYELIIGAKKDKNCGPVIMFGVGGKETEFIKDFAVGLPPLNEVLARRIIEQTRVYEMLLNGSHRRPAVNIHHITDIIVKISDMVVDFPEIAELDINPVAVGPDIAVALDIRLILEPEVERSPLSEYGHLIISPYPTRYVTPWETKDGKSVLLRPIKPEDEEMERKALEGLSEDALRLRFFSAMRKITHEMLTRFCNIDYDREMVIIAEYNDPVQGKRSVGNSRLLIQPNGTSGEFAVYVADDFRNVGLGLKLVDMVLGIGREKGLETIYGIALNENQPMLTLARRLGFVLEKYSQDETKFTIEL